MIERTRRTRWLVMLPATLSVALGGCAVDGPAPSPDAETSARLITQNAPAPDYTVHYWNALRACLQTGRSGWECKSGEDRFVRDALAVEAELSAQRQQRRADRLKRADFRGQESTFDSVDQPDERAPRSQSLMFDAQPSLPSVPAAIAIDLNLKRPSDD